MADEKLELKSFTFWESYADAVRDLPPRTQGEIYRAIVEFTLYGNDLESTLTQRARLVYKLIKTHLKTSRNRAKSGVAGGNRRWEQQEAIANDKQNDGKNIASSRLSSRLSSRSNDDQDGGSESVENTDPPECPNCGRKAWKVGGKWYCPDCARTVVA